MHVYSEAVAFYIAYRHVNFWQPSCVETPGEYWSNVIFIKYVDGNVDNSRQYWCPQIL